MAVFSGGDVVEIVVTDLSNGNATFLQPMANQTLSLNVGGYQNDDGGAITAAGNLIMQTNAMAASFECDCATDPVSQREVFQLNSMIPNGKGQQIQISHISGINYIATGFISGDLTADLNTAKFTLKFKCNSNNGIAWTIQ